MKNFDSPYGEPGTMRVALVDRHPLGIVEEVRRRGEDEPIDAVVERSGEDVGGAEEVAAQVGQRDSVLSPTRVRLAKWTMPSSSR